MHILAIIFGFMLVIYLVLLLGRIQMQLWEGKDPENTLNIFSIYLKVAGGGNNDSRVHEMDLPTLIQTMKASIAAKKEAKSGKAATDSKTTAAAGSADVQATQAPVTATEQSAPEQKPEEPKVAAEPQEPKNPEVVTSEQEPAAAETEVTKPVATETEAAVAVPEQQTVTTEVKKTADSQAVSEQNETTGQPKNKEAESEKTI